MAIESILIKFFVILTVLFFLPKVIYRFYRIPGPITELVLGIILGILLSDYFYLDDMLRILSTLGIVTLFVYSGMEVDFNFIKNKKRFFIENLMLYLLIFFVIGLLVKMLSGFSYQVSYLLSLALITPSASYIISSYSNSDNKIKPWIESKAISGEIFAIILMIVLLRISNLLLLFFVLFIITLLILVLPLILKYLYKKMFSKLIGSEFSFIFVVAIISAFITDFIGVHFLVGAFIAGVVSKRFISNIANDDEYVHITGHKAKQIMVGFGFFSLVFAPFYFFAVGLNITKDLFTLENIFISLLFCLLISLLRIGFMSFHRISRIKEKFGRAARISSMILPTLVFTFVIADILNSQFGIGQNVYGLLLLYGLLTAILSLVLTGYFNKKSKTRQHSKED